MNSYPPGGIVDILARALANDLGKAIGQPVVVDNKAGAGGNIGTAFVAKAVGDAHTLLMGASGPLAINASLYKNVNFDPQKDFTPISLLAATPLVLVVSKKSGFATVNDLSSRLKAGNPMAFYGSAGAGTPQHLAAELFLQKTKLVSTHVAYKGGAPAVLAVLGSEVLYAFENLALVNPHIASGALTALAVTSLERVDLLPDVPTVAESGVPGFEAQGWYGLLAPAGIPAEVTERLTQETLKIAHSPNFERLVATFGSRSVAQGPAAFAKLIAADSEKWRKIIVAGNIKPGI
ncbi:tripartite tricarboxylate transporter substrate-binding protein [Variovorax sp. dw_954]|uniref:Bug family tripartite tricarboxylate transporter substrate binding protein n=1 Tax=Variovorax sp. dw_954 TaxID=2720078 RepID=UPI001BD33BCA